MLTRHCGDHFAIYTNIESVCYIPETNIMLYINYISKNAKKEQTVDIYNMVNLKIIMLVKEARQKREYIFSDSLYIKYWKKQTNPQCMICSFVPLSFHSVFLQINYLDTQPYPETCLSLPVSSSLKPGVYFFQFSVTQECQRWPGEGKTLLGREQSL